MIRSGLRVSTYITSKFLQLCGASVLQTFLYLLVLQEQAVHHDWQWPPVSGILLLTSICVSAWGL